MARPVQMEAMEQRGLRGLVTVEHARLVVEMLVPREVKGVKEQQEFLAVVAELRIPVRPIRVLTVIQEQEETEVQAAAAEQARAAGGGTGVVAWPSKLGNSPLALLAAAAGGGRGTVVAGSDGKVTTPRRSATPASSRAIEKSTASAANGSSALIARG